MKLSDIKKVLPSLSEVTFKLPNGATIPAHFHVTEVGIITKNFIDCGGTVRAEKVVNFQLWEANDFDHRLAPQKLLNIIQLSEKVLGIEDIEVEVEYQSDTIGKYGLYFNGTDFELTTKMTNCLASAKCGIPPEKQRVSLADLTVVNNTTCAPGGNCC
ncbi:MAG: DUF6428 family protein [Bacteroidota bacterium]